ncbi:MAG: hypothetical protein GX162_11355 [Firmicutes bacterium]|nr:hypothetical protein [Bacillota bacterium]
MKRTWIWVAIGGTFVALIAVFLLYRARPPSEEVQIPKPSPEEVELLKIRQVAGSGLAGKLELKKAETTSQGWAVTLVAEVNHVQLDSLLEQASAAFSEMKRAEIPVAIVELEMHTDVLQDRFGRRVPELILKMAFTGETLGKVVWERFDPRDFPYVADEYWLHTRLHPQQEKLFEEKAKEEERGITSDESDS